MEIQQDALTGFFYYDQLPENFRLALLSDFNNLSNCIETRKPFLVQGFYSGRFECYRVQLWFRVEKIKEWLEQGRVYVVKS